MPYELMKRARSRGLFARFHDPSSLLSPFPTLTNVALSSMLMASAPNGYESLYFDRCAQEVRGGVSKYIGRRTPDKAPSSYMDELDYQEPLAFEFLVYVAPHRIWRADMRRFREKFRQSPQDRDFFAFLKGTDGLLHFCGPQALAVALESLDQILTEIQNFCGAETEIVLFSDHGMNLQENQRIHLQTQLRDCGYEVTNQLRGRGRRSLAAPAFGLCGYAALYCADETDPANVADILASLEGVDFSLYRDDASSVVVTGARGTARIRRSMNGQARYAYEMIEGDPLQLAPALRALREDCQLDHHGFASDVDWYALIADHTYPDALANLYGSLFSPRVRHTADVLVSCHDGYYYGAAVFNRFVHLATAHGSLAATHGNALRASSNAFLMSTQRAFPSHVRACEARPLLRG